MKTTLLSALVGLSLLTPGFVSAKGMTPIERFESKTSLSSNWERPENRAIIEARLKLNHSNMLNGEFFERSYGANVVEIGKYSIQVRCFFGEKEVCKKKAVR